MQHQTLLEQLRKKGARLPVVMVTGHGDIAHLADHTISSVAELPVLLRSIPDDVL